MADPAPAATAVCPECGTELAPSLLSCPACHGLVHAGELKTLALQAEEKQAAGDVTGALSAWRRALERLPQGSRQHAKVAERAAALSARVDAGEGGPAKATAAGRPGWVRRFGPLGVIALLAWKLKFVVVFVLTKAKLLLLGLTKSGTLLSMLASLGVYWTAFGWTFALGLVLSMYVHEMGHVAALQRFGIRATAPMFVPGLGAFVRLNQYPASAVEDARVGLAGPLWGLGAVAFAYAGFLATAIPVWAAVAHFGAWLDLFNLVPVWQLDGGRGFRALSRAQRFVVVAACGAAFFFTGDGLLGLLAIVGGVRAAAGTGAPQGDSRTLVEFLVLVAGLSAFLNVASLLPASLPP